MGARYTEPCRDLVRTTGVNRFVRSWWS
jgi:hypothetical protein